jgi:hypothetical protein
MLANHRALARLAAGLALSLPASACRYDIDKIYTYAEDQTRDGGQDASPSDLIDLWEEGSLSDECVACAKDKCSDVNVACREDAECAALTRCVSQARNPADQYDCRAEHVEWLAQSIQERDIGGPYQQCVFLNACGNECDSHAQLECTRQFDWPMTDPGVRIPVHLRFVEGLDAIPVAGLAVRACRAEDSERCQPTSAPEHLTDDDGVVHLEVAPSLGGFQGYFELSGSGIYPTLLRFGWPIARELVTNVVVVSTQNVNLLVYSSGADVDDERGLVQLRAFGCNGITARGVSFAVEGADEKTAFWYTTGPDLYPVFTATATADRGAGGIINVPPGRRPMTASYEDALMASLSAPVRAGHMTIVVLLPGDSSLGQ